MEKAVFLDRDGVINKEIGKYTCNVNDFIINEGVGEAIALLKNNGFLIIIISNQGGIAKKLYDESDLLEMHIKLCQYLEKYNTKVDDFYFCPHHPDFTKCLCRKPDSLMLEKAIAYHDIDINSSYLIGDSDRDIESAKKIGLKSFKVEANENILKLCESIINNNG